MIASEKEKLRTLIRSMLLKDGLQNSLSDAEPLFTSGRLNSFFMMKIVMNLEESFGVEFSQVDVDVSLIDSIDDIERFVDSHQ